MRDYAEREAAERRRRDAEARFAREDEMQEDADIRAVMSTEAGRRVFSGIVWRGYVFGKVFAASCGDANRLAYETGRREYAVDIYRKANALAPAMVLKALEERSALCEARRREIDSISETED